MKNAPGAFDCLSDIQDAAEFFDPLHFRIVQNIAATWDGGRAQVSVSAVALRMVDDVDLLAMGGRDYLTMWALAAPVDCSREVIELEIAHHRQIDIRARIAHKLAIAHTAMESGDPGVKRDLEALAELLAAASGLGQPLIKAVPFCWKDVKSIPTRDWLYGHHLVRKFLSCTIAPGGVGKTALGVAEELAIVTGRPLLGIRPPHPLRVWSVNLEDPAEETDRRIAAACLYYGINANDIGGRLFTTSGRDSPLVIARGDRNGFFIVQPVIDRVIAEIRANGIDVLRIDPFVSCHTVPESDNMAMDMVAKEWAKVGDRGNCAVDIVHHTRKSVVGFELTSDDGRGAIATVNAARSARVLNRMTDKEAEKAGVDHPRRYFRVTTDKLNLAPPAEASDWFKLESIDIGNGPPSDHVGVVVSWSWPDAFSDISPGTLLAVQKAIAGGSWRADPQARDWAGKAVADVLGLEISDKFVKSKCRKLLQIWISGAALKIVSRKDATRKERDFVEVDQWETK